jgi:hypothetical protein
VKILVVENNTEELAPHVERYLSVLEAEGYEIVRRKISEMPIGGVSFDTAWIDEAGEIEKHVYD